LIFEFTFVLATLRIATALGGGRFVMKVTAPAYVPREHADLFKVTEPGWYAFDDDHIPVLGPFNSREECVEAIRKAAE
jgi:hypothetical protein